MMQLKRRYKQQIQTAKNKANITEYMVSTEIENEMCDEHKNKMHQSKNELMDNQKNYKNEEENLRKQNSIHTGNENVRCKSTLQSETQQITRQEKDKMRNKELQIKERRQEIEMIREKVRQAKISKQTDTINNHKNYENEKENLSNQNKGDCTVRYKSTLHYNPKQNKKIR
jgi:hypothetical protein